MEPNSTSNQDPNPFMTPGHVNRHDLHIAFAKYELIPLAVTVKSKHASEAYIITIYDREMITVS